MAIIALEGRVDPPGLASRMKAALGRALRRAIDARMRQIQFEIDFHGSIGRHASEYGHSANDNTHPGSPLS